MTDSRTDRPAPRRDRVHRRRRLTLVGVVGLIALVGAGLALAAGGDDGDAPAGVRLDGVDVGGLGADAVAAKVRARAAELLRVPLVITRTDDPAYRLEVSRASLGARPQVRRAVSAALEPRGLGGRILSRLGIAPTREVPLRFTLDPVKVAALVARITRAANTPAHPAGLRIGAGDIAVVPGVAGFGVDPVSLRAQILALPRQIPLTPATLVPEVTDAAAAVARAQAIALTDAPVEITLQGRGVSIEPAVLRSALRVSPRPPALRVTLDPETLHRDIASAFSSREHAARDASLQVVGSSVRLVPSRVGRGLDMSAIAAAIAADPSATSVRARFVVTTPEVTTKQVRALKVTDLVSEFTTPYNCCEPRVTNIQRAAAILDGTIIPAGGRFSLNEALGQRTLERGFVSAPQIAGGRLEDAVGGGVSQVATTMYNAAFFAGLQLVAHTPHQFWISRYPPGREATVSYGGPELVFVNDWPAAILISATAGSNGITVRFFSSRLDRRVETTTGEKTDVVEPTTHETLDPSLPPGARMVEQEMGGAGFTISYTRKVYAGDSVRRDETFTWTYDAEDAFVKVGPPKEKPRRPQTTTAPGRVTAPGTVTAPASPAPPTGTTTGSGAAPPP